MVDLSVRSAGGDHSLVSDEKHSCCVEGDFKETFVDEVVVITKAFFR